MFQTASRLCKVCQLNLAFPIITLVYLLCLHIQWTPIGKTRWPSSLIMVVHLSCASSLRLSFYLWCGQATINPSVHTMAIYGSFNIRTLFNEKHKLARAVTPKDIADLFGWFHTVYYFETFVAFGEANTVNKSNAGETLFTNGLPLIFQSCHGRLGMNTLKKRLHGWHWRCIDSKRDISPQTQTIWYHRH